MHAFKRTLAAFVLACASMAQAADYAILSVDVPMASTQAEGRWKIVAASEIGAPPGTDLLWDVTRPATKLFAVSDDEQQIVFWIGKEPVEVRCDWVNFTTHKRGRIKITYTPEPAPVPPPPGPGPDPGPTPTPPGPTPPEPSPRPSGLAGAIYDQAMAVNRPEDARKLSDNFWAVTIGIANAKKFQGGDRNAPEPRYYTIAQALSAVHQANDKLKLDPAWKPFGDWLFSESLKNVQHIDNIHTFYYATAEGLKAAGGVKK